jgi:asparagine synthetase B (glutamine-hydrolysing)
MFRQIGGGTVVCGDGGNEVFGGVPKFFQLMAALGKTTGAVGSGRSMLNLAQRLWHHVHARGEARLFYNAARLYFKIAGPRGTRASKLATPAEFERALELYASLEAIWSPALIRAITGPSSPVQEFADSGIEWFRSFAPTSERSDIVQRLIAMRLRATIAHNTVPYVERTATAAGVDTRFPFLDDRLVAYLTTLPVKDNYACGYRDLMRRSVSRGIPRSSFTTLRGFLPPMEMWLRTSRWREVVEEMLSSRAVAERGWFAPVAVADLLRRFYAGDVSMPTERAERRQSLAMSIWALCALETFCREFP